MNVWRRELAGLGVVLALVLLAFVGIAVISPVGAAPGRGLVAEALGQPGLPLELTRTTAQSYSVTRETRLSYTLANRSGYDVEEVSLVIASFDADGKPRAGQVVHEKISLAAGDKVRRDLALGNLLYVDPRKEYARIVVGIGSVRGDQLSWSVPLLELITAMKGESAVPAPEPLSATEQAAEGSSECGCAFFCGETGLCPKVAQKLCEPRGVCTFSCTCGAEPCTCTFSCCANPDIPLP